MTVGALLLADISGVLYEKAKIRIAVRKRASTEPTMLSPLPEL